MRHSSAFALVMASAALLGPATVPVHAALAPMACRATAAPQRPVQYWHVVIDRRSAADAAATVAAHYMTTTPVHNAMIGDDGTGETDFSISGATVGYRVVVTVDLVKGKRRGHCETYFIARRG